MIFDKNFAILLEQTLLKRIKCLEGHFYVTAHMASMFLVLINFAGVALATALPCLYEMEGQAQAKMSIKTLPFTWQVNTMREWLSGRALPCQGKCRGFESRLPLQIWYHRQAVRQRSAKPLFPGSNPGGTSKKQGKGS